VELRCCGPPAPPEHLVASLALSIICLRSRSAEIDDVHPTSTPKKLPLLRGDITYESARTREVNVLLRLSYPEKTVHFFTHLYQHREEIYTIVSRHLGLHTSQCCRLGEFQEWLHGTFSVCIPIYIDNWDRRRVVIRCPLPYKVGESQHPGAAEEKLRCEVATYIWIRQHCPDIPIPCLWGFGFASGLDVSRCLAYNA
jgi:hypothetical protein